jgi:hypothetical protein
MMPALAVEYAGKSGMLSRKAIDDMLMIAPPPAARIDGATAWGGEEHMPQIGRLVVVPVVRRHVIEIMAVVARGVVDKHADRPGMGDNGFHRPADRLDIAQVDLMEAHRMQTVARQAVNECMALVDRDIDERDLCALACEALRRSPRRYRILLL